MIPREILKKIRQIEIRTNRIVTESLAGADFAPGEAIGRQKLRNLAGFQHFSPSGQGFLKPGHFRRRNEIDFKKHGNAFHNPDSSSKNSGNACKSRRIDFENRKMDFNNRGSAFQKNSNAFENRDGSSKKRGNASFIGGNLGRKGICCHRFRKFASAELIYLP